MDFHRSRPGRGDWEHDPYLSGRDRMDEIRARAAVRRGEPIEPPPHRTPNGPPLEVDPRLLERPLPTRAAWDGHRGRPSAPGLALTARDIMTTELAEVMPEATVLAVTELMRAEDVGIVPVIDERRHLLGVVTDRDVVVRVLALGRDPARVTARQVMTTQLACVDLDAPVTEIVAVMAERRVRRVPVIDRNHHVVGMVSLEDLVRRADVHEELQELLCRTAGRRSFWHGHPWR